MNVFHVFLAKNGTTNTEANLEKKILVSLTLHMCYGYRRIEANYLLVRRIFGQTVQRNETISISICMCYMFCRKNLRLSLTFSDYP